MEHMKAGQAMVNEMLAGQTSELLFGKKLVVFSIFLIALLPPSFLHVFHLIFTLLKEELHATDLGDSSTFMKVFIIALGWMFAFFLIFYITFLFAMIITVHYASDTYMRKSISLKDLLLKTATSWKRLVIAWPSICVTIGYIFLTLPLMLGFKIVFASDGMTKWVGLIEFVVAIYMAYHIVLWTVVYVVSVIEECEDLRVLERARHLIGGRKVHVCLMLFPLLVYAPSCLLLHHHFSYDDRVEILRYVRGCLVTTLFFGIDQLYVSVGFTMLYYELKKCHGEKEVKISI